MRSIIPHATTLVAFLLVVASGAPLPQPAPPQLNQQPPPSPPQALYQPGPHHQNTDPPPYPPGYTDTPTHSIPRLPSPNPGNHQGDTGAYTGISVIRGPYSYPDPQPGLNIPRGTSETGRGTSCIYTSTHTVPSIDSASNTHVVRLQSTEQHGSTNGGGNSGSDNEEDLLPVPRRTPMACRFCRGRKLKCDGVKPICSNCNKRGYSCTYISVAEEAASKGTKRNVGALNNAGKKRQRTAPEHNVGIGAGEAL